MYPLGAEMTLRKNQTDFRDFWRAAAEAARVVAKWPSWKRGEHTASISDKTEQISEIDDQREFDALKYLRKCHCQITPVGVWISKDGKAFTRYETYTDAAMALGWKMETPA